MVELVVGDLDCNKWTPKSKLVAQVRVGCENAAMKHVGTQDCSEPGHWTAHGVATGKLLDQITADVTTWMGTISLCTLANRVRFLQHRLSRHMDFVDTFCWYRWNLSFCLWLMIYELISNSFQVWFRVYRLCFVLWHFIGIYWGNAVQFRHLNDVYTDSAKAVSSLSLGLIIYSC